MYTVFSDIVHCKLYGLHILKHYSSACIIYAYEIDVPERGHCDVLAYYVYDIKVKRKFLSCSWFLFNGPVVPCSSRGMLDL